MSGHRSSQKAQGTSNYYFLSQGAFSELKKAMDPLLQKAQVPFQGLHVLAEAHHSQPLAEKLRPTVE